jgi:hypothetical protein
MQSLAPLRYKVEPLANPDKNLTEVTNMKTAIVFFMLGIGQGAILLDWYRDKQTINIMMARKKK